jgi:hypothetical protein
LRFAKFLLGVNLGFVFNYRRLIGQIYFLWNTKVDIFLAKPGFCHCKVAKVVNLNCQYKSIFNVGLLGRTVAANIAISPTLQHIKSPN